MSLNGRLSKNATKKLFFNADDSILFSDSAPQQIQEIRPEAPRIDPYDAIKERNEALDKARFEAAKISDPTQVLIKEPYAISKTETVTLAELPAVVRQAAEAAIIKRYRRGAAGQGAR